MLRTQPKAIMKTSLQSCVMVLGILAWPGLAVPAQAENSAQSEAPPPGSLILRGAKPSVSPEEAFGLSLEQADRNSRPAVLDRAFDHEAFCRRFIPSLPAVEAFKSEFYAIIRTNVPWQRQVLKEAAADVLQGRVRYLGARSCGADTELLFRVEDPARADTWTYVGYAVRRKVDGTIAVIDVHRFGVGELLSQTVRRRTLLELAREGRLAGSLDSRDQATVANLKVAALFESRCDSGTHSQIKEAFDLLPSELQNDRIVLYRFATCGQPGLRDVLVPVERWRRLYPEDPCPNLILADFYWHLYSRTPSARTPYPCQLWTPEQERDVLAATERADAWFADPAMDIRTAKYFGSKKPEIARRLLRRALDRYPLEPAAFEDLLKIDLATENFPGVAETLHLQEVALETNLVAMVNASREYAEFRNSFSWKKWLHDSHGADPKRLMNAPAK